MRSPHEGTSPPPTPARATRGQPVPMDPRKIGGGRPGPRLAEQLGSWVGSEAGPSWRRPTTVSRYVEREERGSPPALAEVDSSSGLDNDVMGWSQGFNRFVGKRELTE